MGVSKSNRAASYTAQLWSGQKAGVGAGSESYYGGRVYGFVGVAVGRDIVEKAVGRGEIMLSWVKLVGGELTDSGKEGKVQCSRVEKQGSNYLWWWMRLCGEERVAVDEGVR